MILSGLFSTRLDSVVMSLSIYCYFSPRNTLCRKIQSRLDSYGLVRTRLALAVINLNTRLDSSGFVWIRLDLSGLFWTRLDSSGLFWTRLDLSGLVWTRLHLAVINEIAYSYFIPRHTFCRKTRSRLYLSRLIRTHHDSSLLGCYELKYLSTFFSSQKHLVWKNSVSAGLIWTRMDSSGLSCYKLKYSSGLV